MKRLLLAAALLAGACAQAPQTYRDLDRLGREYSRQEAQSAQQPANAEQATARDTCGASRLRHLVGTRASQIDRASLPPRTRIITPGMMVTQDFSPQRLNIHVAPDGNVAALDCF